MLKVETVQSRSQFLEVRQSWLDLWEQTPDATPWQHPDWFDAHFLTSPVGASPLALLISAHRERLGVLPLVVCGQSPAVLKSAGSICGQFAGPLGQDPTVTLLTCANFLRDHPNAGEVFDWGYVTSSGMSSRVNTALRLSGLSYERTSREVPGAIELTSFACWFEYLRNASVDLLAEWKSAEDQLQRFGAFSVRSGELPNWTTSQESPSFQHFFKRYSWLRKLQNRFNTTTERFCFRAFSVLLDDSPIAVVGTIQQGATVWVLPMASQSEYGFSPLVVLLGTLVQDAFEEGIDHIHFAEELPAFLQSWLTKPVSFVRFTASQPTIRSRWKHFRWKRNGSQAGLSGPIS